jgi:hypothetical protein
MIIPNEGGSDQAGQTQPPEAPSSTTNITVIMLAERIYQRVYA